MISIFNHRFSTPNRAGVTAFPLMNEGQLITHQFDISFNFNFNSNSVQQIIISNQNELTLLNGTWQDKGIVAGDSIDIDAVVTSGTDIDVTATVQSVNGSILVLTSNVFASNEVNELFPLGNNQEMFIVNNSRTVPELLEIFYNLVPFNSSGSNQSLWDGEVNRFQVNVPTVDSVVNFTQLGNKSGGSFFECTLEKSGSTYTASFEFIPWLGNQTNDFTEPSWYASFQTLKPYIELNGQSQAGNPNNVIKGVQSAWIGNTGWYNEAYSQGVDNFTVSELEFEDDSANPLDGLTLGVDNVISFRVSNSGGDVDTNAQMSLYSFFPNSETKNNAFTRLDNQIGNWFNLDNGDTLNGEKNSATIVVTAFSSVDDSGDILVNITYKLSPEFNAYVQSFADPIPYRLAINVDQGDTTLNNVTKIVHEGFWISPPPQPTEITSKEDGFNDHSEILTDPKDLNYIGCTEDDMMFSSVINFETGKVYDNLKFQIQAIRNSDSAIVAVLQNVLFDFTNVVFLNGKHQLNISLPQNQFLDSEDRNVISLKLNGNESVGTYEVELIASLMANWREWVPLLNLLPDFYNFTIPSNGQSAEWMRYLRISGYSLRLRIELNAGQELFFKNHEIELRDYDEADEVNSEIVVLDSLGNPVTALLNNQTYTIRAIHTVIGGNPDWGSRVWGFIGIRPNQGEPMKRISTAYNWSAQNLPLQPLTSETEAKLTFPSGTIAWVECQVNSNDLNGINTIVARINDYENAYYNVTKRNIQKFNQGTRLPEQTIKDCCGEPWLVLADPADSTTWKNDHTLVFERCDTLTVYTRYNGGEEEEALGVVVNFPNDPLAKGFVIDWRLYIDGSNQLIQGNYDVWVETTFAGITEKFFFNSFRLLKFTKDNSEGTVRIASIFNKYSELYDIDFSGSGARDASRLRGFFGYRQPNYEVKNNTEISKKRENVFRKSNNTYALIIEPTKECKTQRIEQLHLLHASICYISDFNSFNHYEHIKDLPVILSDETSPEFDYFEGVGTKYAKVLATFKDRVSKRKSRNTGEGVDVDIPNIGLWTGSVSPIPVCEPVTYNVEYANGDPIASGSEPSGGNIEVIVPNPDCPNPPNTGIYKSGQTINVLPSDTVRKLEGMGANWWNLDAASQNANIFGHYKRFTGTSGSYQDEVNGLFYDKDGVQIADYATAFPLGIVVDWSTRDWQNGKVLAYGIDNIVAGVGDTRLALDTLFEALTIGIYSNWKLPNTKELFNLLNFGLSDRTGYRPFNNINQLNTNFWTRDSRDTLTGVRINIGTSTNVLQVGRSLTEQNRGLPVSYLTISGNTLI